MFCVYYEESAELNTRRLYSCSIFAAGLTHTNKHDPLTQVALILDQRRRRWVSIKTALFQRLGPAGMDRQGLFYNATGETKKNSHLNLLNV